MSALLTLIKNKWIPTSLTVWGKLNYWDPDGADERLHFADKKAVIWQNDTSSQSCLLYGPDGDGDIITNTALNPA